MSSVTSSICFSMSWHIARSASKSETTIWHSMWGWCAGTPLQMKIGSIFRACAEKLTKYIEFRNKVTKELVQIDKIIKDQK